MEYVFWTHVTLSPVEVVTVEADSLEDAKEKAAKELDEIVNNIPTSVGEVLRAEMVWEEGNGYNREVIWG